MGDLGFQHFAEEAEQVRRKKISESRRDEMVENVPPSQKSRDQAARAAGNPARIDSVECPTFNDLVRGNTYL